MPRMKHMPGSSNNYVFLWFLQNVVLLSTYKLHPLVSTFAVPIASDNYNCSKLLCARLSDERTRNVLPREYYMLSCLRSCFGSSHYTWFNSLCTLLRVHSHIESIDRNLQ